MILALQQPHAIEAHVVRPLAVAPTPALLSTLKAPEGFRLTRFVDGVSNPRIVKVRPDGTVYATQRSEQNIVMFKDLDGDGVADTQREVASGTDMHGLAFTSDGKTAYVVGIRKLWRIPVLPDGAFGPKKELMDDLPDAGQHPNRTVEVGPDGRVYVSCGSTANDAVEHNPYNATVVVCDGDGGHRAILASGLRNTIGFDWDAQGRLFGWDQGIDWLGDDEQREEVNLIEKGRRYGWPFVYEDGKPDLNAHLPSEKGYTLEGWLKESVSPETTYTAHAAGMQMRFYRGAMFPNEYRGDAFATMHGSWNRKPPSGYEIVRVHFEDGKARSITPFLTGFLQNPKAERPSQFGRLCGLAEMPDGSLLIGDDEHGAIYRLVYGAPSEKAARLSAIDTTRLSPDLVDVPKKLDVKLGSFGEKNSEYAPGRAVSPEIAIRGLPAGTRTVALAMEDPDAPTIKPVVHWLAADLAVDERARAGAAILPGVRPGDAIVADPSVSRRDALPLPGGLRKATLLQGGAQGGTSPGRVGYYGPKPPVGDKPHRYHFTVYALDAKLGLKPGFNRLALIDAMRGHVLAQGTAVGEYAKAP